MARSGLLPKKYKQPLLTAVRQAIRDDKSLNKHERDKMREIVDRKSPADLFSMAERYGITLDQLTPDPRFTGEAGEDTSEDASEEGETLESATEDATKAAETLDAEAERMFKGAMDLLGAQQFDRFADIVRTACRKSLEPPRTVTVEVIREVEVQAAPAGSRPIHQTKMIKRTTAAEALGLRDPVAKSLPLAIWDAPDAPAVDPHFRWFPETAAALSQMKRGAAVMLVGPAGTGKSTWPEQFAARTGRPFYRIVCTEQTDAPSLVGMVSPKGDWQDGVLAHAIRRPGAVILIDEPSVARAGAVFAFQSVLERGARALWIDEVGMKIDVAPGVVFVMADNTGGNGDPTGQYNGTRLLNRATLDRAGATVYVDYMAPDLETEVLVNRTDCKKALAELIVRWANLTRKDNSLSHGIGLRRLVSLCEMITDGVPAPMAYDLAVHHNVSHDDRERLRQLWQTTVNGNPALTGA